MLRFLCHPEKKHNELHHNQQLNRSVCVPLLIGELCDTYIVETSSKDATKRMVPGTSSILSVKVSPGCICGIESENMYIKRTNKTHRGVGPNHSNKGHTMNADRI